MGFFSNVLKDFSDSGTPVGELRKKIKSLTNLLMDYSYREGNLSLEATKKSIERMLNETLSASTKCSHADVVRIHSKDDVTIEVPIHMAVDSFKFWVQAVVEDDFKFTTGLVRHVLKRVKHNVNREMRTPKYTKGLSSSVPNFMELMRNISLLNKGVYMNTDDDNKVEYKMPLVTSRNVMGYISYTLEKDQSEEDIYNIYQIITPNIGKAVTSKIVRVRRWDQTTEFYDEIFNNIFESLRAEGKLLQIALTGTYQ